MRFVVIDLETTSREPEQAHIVEVAAFVPSSLFGETKALNFLVRPPVHIPAETSAVHHITDADVLDAQTWDRAQLGLRSFMAEPGTICVAHNAEYESTILARVCPEAFKGMLWLCTYKAALRAWPDAPGHSNEVLRYHLGLRKGRREDQRPHSALHDAMVTAEILAELLKVETPENMIAWTKEPALLPTCPIGKWRGAKWPDVDYGFLDWIINKAADMREDIKHCARQEIKRRQGV